MEQLINISQDEILNPGDTIEIHYKAFSNIWVKAAQLAIIESQLKQRKDFETISVNTENSSDLIKIRIKIIKPKPDPTENVQHAGVWSIAAAAAVIGSVIGLVAWVTLEGTYKVIEETKQVIATPQGKIIAGGLGTLALASGLAALIALLPKK